MTAGWIILQAKGAAGDLVELLDFHLRSAASTKIFNQNEAKRK
jgi:hypothetical protein